MIKVAASGYFSPIHRGHIEYLKKAKELGDYLVVIVNNDKQLERNKKRFYPIEDRISVIKELRCVDEVVESIDTDKSVCRTLEMVKPDIFAKGGDRFQGEIPEKKICDKLGIRIIDGLGKKVQSSSWILKAINKKYEFVPSFTN